MKVGFLGIVSLALCLMVGTVYASPYKTGDMRVGLQSGPVGLLQDVGSRSGSALGYGAFFNYASSEELMFEVGYIASEHTRLSHTELPIGFNFYPSTSGFSYHLAAGVTFITNRLDEKPVELSSSGFGVYVGGGGELPITRNINAGLQLKYVKGFEQTVQLGDGSKAKSLQDNYTLFLRLSYIFFSEGGKF